MTTLGRRLLVELQLFSQLLVRFGRRIQAQARHTLKNVRLRAVCLGLLLQGSTQALVSTMDTRCREPSHAGPGKTHAEKQCSYTGAVPRDVML
ncbi:hypothetical protein V8C34DRAFT_281041 [Trichoderma compactum]